MVVGNPWCGPTRKKSEEALAPELARRDDGALLRRGDGGRHARRPRRRAGVANATEHERGIATLWLNSRNLLAYRARRRAKTPFYLYVANRLNGTAG